MKPGIRLEVRQLTHKINALKELVVAMSNGLELLGKQNKDLNDRLVKLEGGGINEPIRIVNAIGKEDRDEIT